MNIYVATSGEYSDYGIEEVFTDKKQAELYCATHGCYLEVYEADRTKIETEQNPKFIWECGENWRGEFIYNNYGEMTFKDIFIKPRYSSQKLKISLDADVEDEKVKKILKDKYMQWKLERENI
ncbi:MAG: hypothetical protein IKV64_06210 [Clostridia bacterium]|nr:hypothetical protein [Clostridia bacterium]